MRFTVMVIGENPEDQLAPFDFNGLECEEGRIPPKWDRCILTTEYIKLKPGVEGKSISVFQMGEFVIDQARKGDIENLDEIVTVALLKNGQWQEDKPGYHPITSGWKEHLKQTKLSLPEDTLISIYECHI